MYVVNGRSRAAFPAEVGMTSLAFYLHRAVYSVDP
jgi:hypothetical protein